MRRYLVSALLLLAVLAPATRAVATSGPPPAGPGGPSPTVSQPAASDVSPPLSSMTPTDPGHGRAYGARNRNGAFADTSERPQDAARPAPIAPATATSTATNWEGINNVNGVIPPDTNGDVGPNHYVQWVNLSFEIWDKSGNRLYGPAGGNTLWTGFGGVCETTNHGDPVVLYDKLTDRWLFSQFAFNTDGAGNPIAPYYQCIAVSKTADPTGAFNRYSYKMATGFFNDYPKFGVWSDGYYMSANLFNGNTFAGAAAFAFDKNAMINGLSKAAMVEFDLGANYAGILPSNFDGKTANAPPAGAPNTFAGIDTSGFGTGSTLQLWKFHADFTTPTLSTFGVGATHDPNTSLGVASYNFDFCNYSSCIPQPGTSQLLDTLSDRLMNRLEYRNYGGHESLVVNHTVNLGGGHAGIRWYEVRTPASPTVYQSGTIAPDATNRWMASMATDKNGDMAVAYSASSSSVYPSILRTGRMATDALGTMPVAETTIVAGGGSETYYGRWGDYSSMSVDPVDDCTFWFTSEYMAATSNAGWQTRVANFKYPSCSAGATTTTTVTNTPSTSAQGASVALSATVTGGTSTPTGTVDFFSGSTKVGTGTLNSGSATANYIWTTPGTFSVTATYNGDNTHAASTSAAVTQTVTGKPASTTNVATSGTPSTYGNPVTFTATVLQSGATGTVTFTDGAASLGTQTLSGGTASVTTSALAVGTHTITASYSGDPTYASSSGTVSQVVNGTPTTTGLTVSPSSTTYGQAVTFTATVSPSAAKGTVTFLDGPTTLGTGTLSNGVATLTTTSLSTGGHTVTASYGGDPTYAGSTSPGVAVTVAKRNRRTG